jgi:hypothetical protein
MYDAKSMKPVWTYSPKTMDPATLQQQAGPYASTVVGLMQSNGLLGTYVLPSSSQLALTKANEALCLHSSLRSALGQGFGKKDHELTKRCFRASSAR